MKIKTLVFGKNGQVGTELQSALLPLGEVKAYAHQDCDICDEKSLRQLIKNESPQIIVNAAAYTKVDLAEEEKDLCFKVNAEAPKIIAKMCKEFNVLLVHYSTDYVFDGESNQPWLETDKTNPQNVYGESKLAGENFIVESDCNHLILRTSWVYSTMGNNFLLTMIRLAKERDALSIVNDQFGAPTWSRTIAHNTFLLLKSIIDNDQIKDTKDLLHFTATGITSWHGFATEIINLAKQKNDLKIKNPDQISGIPSDQYPQKAKRPKYSALNTNLIKNRYHLTMPHWQDELERCLQDL